MGVSKHRGSLRWRRWAGLAAVALLVGAVVVTGPSLARQAGFDLALPWDSGTPSCPPVQVKIAVAPEIADAVRTIVQPIQGSRQPDGNCLQAVVMPQTPSETVRSAQVLPASRAFQLWIPDSALWERQIDRWPARPEGSLATSPLVVATSEAVVAKLGWAANPPTWAQALSGVRPVAMPDLQNNASGVLSILGLWQTLGKKNTADQAVAAAVLASTRSTAPTPASVVTAALRNDPKTPLLITSELNVFSTNRGNASSRLVAVYPKNGSPSLDYPILRLSPQTQGVAHSIATDTVVAALRDQPARDIVRRSGLRDATGTGPGGTGVATGAVNALDIPDPAEVTAFLTRLESLTRPSQLTVVIDVSLSMKALIGGRLTRAQLAGQAASNAGDLMSDKSSVSLWVFSRNLAGAPAGTNFRQVDKLIPLGRAEGTGRTHRQVVENHLLALNNELSGDGTALYATTVAAMRSAHEAFDPAAVNSVVVFTDGVNDDTGGISLAQATAELTKLADTDEPVRLIAVGLGPDADLGVLKKLVAPSKGAAYLANSPEEVKTVLFDALAHRTPTA